MTILASCSLVTMETSGCTGVQVCWKLNSRKSIRIAGYWNINGVDGRFWTKIRWIFRGFYMFYELKKFSLQFVAKLFKIRIAYKVIVILHMRWTWSFIGVRFVLWNLLRSRDYRLTPRHMRQRNVMNFCARNALEVLKLWFSLEITVVTRFSRPCPDYGILVER